MEQEPHVSRTPCHRCGGIDAVIIRNGPHAEVRCATDNAHLYFAPKVEIGEVNAPVTIKPIETRYAGCRFRSRLEARWAVFFDALDIEWQYELEGFDLPSGRYLPDFYLPSLETWFEVKGQPVTWEHQSARLAGELTEMTGKRVVIAGGDIPRRVSDLLGNDQEWMYCTWKDWDWPEVGGEGYYLWCLCPTCHSIGIEFDGRGERVCDDRCSTVNKSRTHDHPILAAAYKAARSARFEFGESGAAA
jgi:hypothetical protein